MPGQVQASLIGPGHPLMDAVVNVTLERHRGELKRGAVLVDESDEGTAPHLLLILEHSVHDGRRAKDGQPLTISRRLQSVFLDPQGGAVAGGAAPYLDFRPATARGASRTRPSLQRTRPG